MSTPPSRRPTVIVADDHQMMIDSFVSHLGNDYDVILHVNDGEALVLAVRELRPDIVVSDISMPKLSGFDAAKKILAELPETIIILATATDDPELAQAAFAIGVRAYVLKTESMSTLRHMIEMARAGGQSLSAGALLRRDATSRPVSGPVRQAPDPRITPRQLDVMRELARGSSMKEVAAKLGISPRTVAFHKYRVMRLLGIETNAELTRYSVSIGLLDDDPDGSEGER